MSNADKENEVIDAMSNIIGRHADWLDGRTFQRLALVTAEGYFSKDDLDNYGTAEEVCTVLTLAFKGAVEELANQATKQETGQ
ncbi:hypothetical protein [Pseudomonas sp. EL_65y_Pfl2_R95]|uniref:hypothetical protein n=1 Tax=Pseudomonas sp. EL_65y_Pfl2_R95 TaxID=3088698 RepID=UPI0030DCD7A6